MGHGQIVYLGAYSVPLYDLHGVRIGTPVKLWRFLGYLSFTHANKDELTVEHTIPG